MTSGQDEAAQNIKTSGKGTIRLEITIPRPAPSTAEMNNVVWKGPCLAGGSPTDQVYGYRFHTLEQAQFAEIRVMRQFPKADTRILDE